MSYSNTSDGYNIFYLSWGFSFFSSFIDSDDTELIINNLIIKIYFYNTLYINQNLLAFFENLFNVSNNTKDIELVKGFLKSLGPRP